MAAAVAVLGKLLHQWMARVVLRGAHRRVAIVAVYLWSCAGSSASAAQEPQANLTSLMGFRVGASCMELSQAFEALASGGVRTNKVCDPASTDYSSQLIYLPNSTPDQERSFLVLEFQPGGVLWAVTSTAEWKEGAGPLYAEALETLHERFGPPPMFEDYRHDPVVRARKLKLGESSERFQMAWASRPAPWQGSLNIAPAQHACDAGGVNERVACFSADSANALNAWGNHFKRLRGVITTGDITFKGGRTRWLTVKMQLPAVAPLAEAVRKRKAQEFSQRSELFERQQSKEMMPRF